jgi:hypothetical protein
MSTWAFLGPIIDGRKQQWHPPYDPLDHNNHIVNRYGPLTNFVTTKHTSKPYSNLPLCYRVNEKNFKAKANLFMLKKLVKLGLKMVTMTRLTLNYNMETTH